MAPPRAFLRFAFFVLQLTSSATSVQLNNCSCSSVVKTIRFGQSVPLTGSNSLSGTPLRDGILAAFHEFNQDTSPDKTNLRFELVAKDDMYVASLSLQNMQSFADDPEIFGILGNFGTTGIELAAPLAIDRNMPFFPAYGGMNLRQTFYRSVLTMRGSYFDESAVIVEYFVLQSKKRISVFAQRDAFGLSAREGMMAALDSLNLYLHSEAYYTKNMNTSVWQQEVEVAVKNMTSSLLSNRPPDAIVVAAVYEPAAIFIRHIHELWPDTDIVCLSSVSIFGLVDGLAASNDSSVLDHVYSSQFLPNPVTSTDMLVERFRTAAAQVNVPSSNYLALESYVMARVVIAAFQRIKQAAFTRENFLDVIYRDSYFNIDGFRVGPYYPATINGGCNQGIQGSRIVKVFMNRSLADVHEMKFSSCGYRGKVWNKLIFGQSCTVGSGCDSFRDGLLAAFKQINDAGGVRGTTRLLLQTKDDMGNPTVALLNNYELLKDPSIFALIGSSVLSIEEVIQMVGKSNKMLIGAFTGDISLRVPFHRNIINFRASTEDEIFAMIHYCYYNRKLSKFSVLYEQTDYGNSRRDQVEVALQEKRWSIISEASYTSAEQIGEAVKRLFSDSGSKLEVVVFIGLEDVLTEVLTEIHGRNPSILVFGLSETHNSSKLTQNTTASNVNLDNFILASVVPNPRGIKSELNTAYTNALATLNPLASISAAGLEGFVVGHLVAMSLNRVMGKDFTVTRLLDTIYEYGNFNVFGLKCGPFQTVSSNPLTKMSCNQCMRSVFLTTVSGETVKEFGFDDTCLYKPGENLDLQQDTIRLLFSVLAGCGIVFTIINLVFHVILRNNPHISARPFTVKLVYGVGSILWFSDVFVIAPIPTNTTCLLTPWIIDVSFVLMIGPIIARIIALDRRSVKKTKLDKRKAHNHLFFLTEILFVACVVFLVIYSILDPPHMQESFTPEGVRFEKCVTKSKVFLFLDHGLMGVVLVWGVIRCQQVNKTASRISEIKRLTMLMYHATLLHISYSLSMLAAVKNPNIQFVWLSITLIENAVVLISVLLTRPVYKALRHEPFDDFDPPNPVTNNHTHHPALHARKPGSRPRQASSSGK